MSGRTELMEAALEAHPDGVALVDATGQVLFWNRAAEIITGFAGFEIVARVTPWALEQLVHGGASWDEGSCLRGAAAVSPALVRARHKLGGDFAVAARRLVLRDGLGERIGTAVLFRPTEVVDGLSRCEAVADEAPEEAQAQLEERLSGRFKEFLRGGTNLGLIRLMVDQAHAFRRTHGARACEAMMERMQRTLAGGLHSGEELGRWGEDEFLTLTQEDQVAALRARGQALVGLARTSEFRWWGDRISLTISAGVALAGPGETLASLLERAKAAVFASLHAGGNQVTMMPGRQT